MGRRIVHCHCVYSKVVPADVKAAVLERLARLGRGITPAQRNDFPWFKERWDEKMLQEHGEDKARGALSP